MPRGEEAPRALLILSVALAATWVVFACYRPSGTVDLWWTLRVGDHIRAHGEVPRTTRWTMDAVRDLPYIAHGWSSAVVFSAVKDWFGLDAVPAVPTLLGLGVLAAMLRLARRVGVSWTLSVGVAALVLYPLMPRLMNRTESFGYLCFALALNVVAAYSKSGRARSLAWLVPLALVWANCHGSFLIVLGIPPLLAAGAWIDAWRQREAGPGALARSLRQVPLLPLACVWLGVGAATLVNPYGFALIASTLDQSSSRLWSKVITEWRPLYERDEVPLRFTVLALVVGAALVAGRRRLSSASVLLAGAFLVLAVTSYRHVALVGLGSALVLAEFARGVLLGRRAATLATLCLSGVLLAAGASAAAKRDWSARRLELHPSPYVTARGLEYVRRHVRGNVLNSWSIGGLLIYYAYPKVRVCIDSRADPYPPAYLLAYWRAFAGSAEDTLRFVDRYDMDYILVEQARYERWLEPKLAQLDGFRVVFRDGRLVVLARDAARREP
jgi:hypothetical protein